jgi:hypothetical protein
MTLPSTQEIAPRRPSRATGLALLAGFAISCSTPAPPPAGRAPRSLTDPEPALPARLGHDYTIGARGPQLRKVAVDPGGPGEAAPYYAQLENDLGATLGTFNQVLRYFGYEGLRGDDLERLDPAILMDPAALVAAVPREELRKAVAAARLEAGDILSARFFAPRITDVAAKPENVTFGWRKIVRLRARVGSPAHVKGLASIWLLFNIFSNGSQPFTARSANNQVMLIRADGVTSVKPAYWMVFTGFDNLAGDGARIDHLNASFDSRHPGVVRGNRYYIPHACADCHGGLSGGQPAYDTAKLNYLDTDSWFDRTRDDFKTIPPGLGVIFDGGTDTNSEQFRKAFGVIYQLNAEIKAQNAATNGPGRDRFQLRAVNRWLELHQDDEQFADPFDRNIAPPAEAQWTKANQVDAQVLPLLNRYCVRCHSSLRYNIFDKPAVIQRKAAIQFYLQSTPPQPWSMPQDRNLDELAPHDKACLIRLLPLVGTSQPAACPTR